jgi:hypothetical protein
LKTTQGFKYHFNSDEVKNFDEFEKLIKKHEIREINVEGLNIYARTEKI